MGQATLAGAIAIGGMAEATAADTVPKRPRAPSAEALIDTNIYLSRWPFRRLPTDDTPALVTRLRRAGVKRAWAGSFEAILHKDLGAVNARLAEECAHAGRGILVPFGSVNPTLPDWEEELRRCQERFRMPGLRLHPNYHGYTLTAPLLARLLDLAEERALVVQIAVTLEDERTQHPMARVPHVDVLPLISLLKPRPNLRVLLLNWSRGVPTGLLPKLAGTGQVYFDIATLEGVGGLEKLLKTVPSDRVVFGSYAPFFYFESARLKLKESELDQKAEVCVRAANARRLVG